MIWEQILKYIPVEKMRGETILLIKKIRAHFLICLAPKIMHVPAVYFLMETLFAHRPNTISLDICCLA